MKKLLIILTVIVDLLAIALIPVNVFVFSMPDYITIPISALILICNIMLWIEITGHFGGKILLSCFSLLSMIFILMGQYCNPYWNSIVLRVTDVDTTLNYSENLTTEKALDDLEYAMKYIKKVHPACYDGVPNDVKSKYEKVYSEIQSMDSVSIVFLEQKIESIVSMFGDGHTCVYSNDFNLHCLKDYDRHKENGEKLVAVNGHTFSEILKNKRDLLSYDAESWAIDCLEDYTLSLEGLKYLGYETDDGITYTFENGAGGRAEYTYYSSDYAVKKDLKTTKKDPFVSYKIDKKHDLAVLHLKSCINNDEYRTCLKKMFSDIKEYGISNVAVDLRNNGGGDSSVANEFIRYLNVDKYNEIANKWRFGFIIINNKSRITDNSKYDNLTFGGRVYLFTSTQTFSSAMEFAEYIEDNKLGTIIGEPAGNNPSTYGEITTVQLPNSKLCMQISTRKWYRINAEKEGELIQPDIPCDASKVYKYLYEVLK